MRFFHSASVLLTSIPHACACQVISKENAGPIFILIVVGIFQGLAGLPREDLPLWVQDAIPLVLGKQYEIR